VFGTTDQAILRQRARDFFRTFVDGTFEQYAHNVDAIEEWNEYNATSHTGQELAERIAWADAVSWVWKNEYRTVPKLAHVRLVLGNVAVGNDLPWEYARFAAERDAILGYHPYIPWRNKEPMVNEWQYYSGRWSYMDAAFRSRGYRCQWLFTEFGPVGYEPPAVLLPGDGWRHPAVCDTDVDNYLASMRYWLQMVDSWNAQHGGRALGAVLFSSHNAGGVWKHFDTRQPEIDAITQFMEAWGPVLPPEPPSPPPPPSAIRKYSRTAHLLPQNATEPQVLGVLGIAYPKRQTVLFSADDAAINPDPSQATLTAKALHVWGEWPSGSEQVFREWLNLYYAPLPSLTFHPWAELPGVFVMTHWPTDFKTVTQVFGSNPQNYQQFKLPGHEGIDIRAPHGTNCYAAAAGIVYEVEQDDGDHNYGTRVRIRHTDGYKTVYAHLLAATVQVGESVSGGQLIGLCDNTGNSFGDHLHLTLKRDGATAQGLTAFPGDQINPWPYMRHLL